LTQIWVEATQHYMQYACSEVHLQFYTMMINNTNVINEHVQIYCVLLLHSKNCWVVWVKYGRTQPLGYIFLIAFLTQHLGLSIFDPNLFGFVHI